MKYLYRLRDYARNWPMRSTLIVAAGVIVLIAIARA